MMNHIICWSLFFNENHSWIFLRLLNTNRWISGLPMEHNSTIEQQFAAEASSVSNSTGATDPQEA